MSRTLTSISLFQTKTFHDYNADGQCRDFTFHPSAECLQLLNRHKLRFRSTPTGFQVSYQARINPMGQVVPYSPPSEIPEGTRFTFLMELANPDFALKTSLSDPSQPAPSLRNHLFYFDSGEGSEVWGGGNTILEAVKLYDPPQLPGPGDFPRSLPQSGPALSYQVTELNPVITSAQLFVYGPEQGENGLPEPGLSQVLQKDAQNDFKVSLDLNHYPQGAYTFVLKSGNTLVDRRTYYLSQEAATKAAFAVIELRKPVAWDQVPPNQPVEYSIRFLPIKAVWRYFLVFKSSPYPSPGTGNFVLEDRSESPVFFKNITAQSLGAARATGWIKINAVTGNANQVKKIKKIEIGQGNDKINLLENEVIYQTGTDTLATFTAKVRDVLNANSQVFPHNYRAYLDPNDAQKLILLAPAGTGTWPNAKQISVSDTRVNISDSNTLSGGANPSGNNPPAQVNGFPAEIFISQKDLAQPDTDRKKIVESPRKGLHLIVFNPSDPIDTSNPRMIKRGMPLPSLESGGKWLDPSLNTEFNTKDLYFFI